MNRLLCLVVLALAAVGAFAQVRSVVGSGSVHATDGTLHHQGTMGQGAIGHARLGDGSHRYAGFWYRPRTGVTIVAVPNTEGEVGTRVASFGRTEEASGVSALRERITLR